MRDPEWEQLPENIREKLLPTRKSNGSDNGNIHPEPHPSRPRLVQSELQITQDVYLDCKRKKITGTGLSNEIPLMPQQVRILETLLINANMVVTSDEIKEYSDIYSDELLRTSMSTLRTRMRPLLETGKIELITHRGVGYELHIEEK